MFIWEDFIIVYFFWQKGNMFVKVYCYDVVVNFVDFSLFVNLGYFFFIFCFEFICFEDWLKLLLYYVENQDLIYVYFFDVLM